MKRSYSLVLVSLLLLSVLLTACVEAAPTPTPVPVNSPLPSPSPTLTANAATTPPATGKSQHQLFIEPDDGLAPVLNAINSAKTSIDMKMYLLSESRIIEALKTASSQRNLRVRVMLEQNPFGPGPGNTATYQALLNGGVYVRWANPTFRYTHEKSMVIDGNTAFIMTLNLTRSAFGTNREYGVITTQPDEVKEVLNGFNADWDRTQFNPPDSSPLIWSNTNSRQKILKFIGAAKKTLVLEQEETQDSEVQQKLVAAAARGVKVRVLVAGDPTTPDKPDANRPGEEQLKAGGVEVKLIAKPYMHAKIYLADESRAVVCSENISTNSLNNNRELGIILSDQELVRRISVTFESDWAKGT